MRRLLGRLAWSAVVIWAVVSIVFWIDSALPGDPARLVAGPQAHAADVARIREQLGLNQPPLVRYARLWRRLVHVGPREDAAPEGRDPAHATCVTVLAVGGSALHVDLGKSFQYGQPVATLVATRGPRTVGLAAAGLAAQLLLGIGAGIVATLRRGAWLDRALMRASLLGISAPTFLVALLLQYVLAYRMRVLPLDGFGQTAAEHARSVVLPALTLGLYGAAYYARLVRDELSGLVREDWMRTARAKGVGALRAVLVHALRNALVPVATAAALDLGSLMGGSIITETVFRWPGLGDLSVKGTLNRDGPVVVACVVVTSVAIVAANLAVDVLCARLDPRLRDLRGRGTR